MTVFTMQPKPHPEIGENIIIRSAIPTDAPSIASLGHRVFTITFGHSCSAQDLAEYLDDNYTPEVIAGNISNPDYKILVAVDTHEASKVIGYAYLHTGATEECVTGPKPIELMRIYVDDAWHGRHVSTALMAECVALAKAEGYQTMWLGVWEENKRAIRFYEREGYRHVGRHAFWLGKDEQTDEIMERAL